MYGETLVQYGEDVRELLFTRIIDAPRALVFRAWTDPVHFARWWGPHGMTNPICEMDLRVGGAYRIIMRDETGHDHPVSGTYLEIVAPERLVMTVAAVDRTAQPVFLQTWTVTFAECEGKTRLTVVDRFASAADRDAANQMGHAEGASQSFERLAALVEGESP
jgi:uncharacterized protein YndB with AHSA1/START domain